jgi:aspartate-semialdehyde dehydrogenase
MKRYNVAVVGATGMVGRTFVEILEERDFPIAELRLLASERSLDKTIEYKEKAIPVRLLDKNAFSNIDFALFSAGAAVSKKFAPIAAAAGAVVIDNSSAFRMDPAIPLVTPEVNPQDLQHHKGIIANPNCSTIQMVVAVKPLHDAAIVKRIVVSTYQAVSGKGKDAVVELANQARAHVSGGEIIPKVFPYQIVFSALPHIDIFLEDGNTKEEAKMINETRKIMGVPDMAVSATCVRVGVFNGHAESINLEFEREITANQARKLLSDAPGIVVMDSPADNIYPTQPDVSGRDEVFVGRIRTDASVRYGLNMWVVADNLKKGAALNAVQIAEALIS